MRCVAERCLGWRLPEIKSALLISVVLCVIGLFPVMGVLASEDKELEEMQKKLNQGVMEKPFSVEDAAKIDAYIADAMKKNLKPQEKPPASWRPGYTCENLHNYYEYRNCLYYYRYYGRYW
jgi:hypothetical protein